MVLDSDFVYGCKGVNEAAQVVSIKKPVRCRAEKKWIFLKSFGL